MNKTMKINFLGFAFTAMAIVGSTAILSGCGQPPSPTRNGVVAGSQNGQPIYPPQSIGQITDISQLPAAQLDAFVGNYGGTVGFKNEDGDKVKQAFTLSIAKGTSQGKSFLYVSFTSGNLRFTAPMQTSRQEALTPMPKGTYYYTMTSTFQSVVGIEDTSSVAFYFANYIDPSNQVDPTSAEIRIVAGGSSEDAVEFYSDFGRR
jgi:hypothetical protein